MSDASAEYPANRESETIEARIGIKRWKVDLSAWELQVQQIAQEERFTTVASPEDPEPRLSPEHCHPGDEVRLLLRGNAYFVLRVGETDETIQLQIGAGDMISIPAGVWHRFGPVDEEGYQSVRFYHNKATWAKINRHI